MGYSWDTEEAFAEHIDSFCKDIEILGIPRNASFVFKSVDPIAYKTAMDEWLSELEQEENYCFECDMFIWGQSTCHCEEEEE